MARDRLVIESESEKQTIRIGNAIGAVVAAGSVVVLEGELGSGKTRLTWGISDALGVDASAVSSPTYSLVHEYAARRVARMIHADAYRMDGGDADDLETLLGTGGDGDWVAIIEWGSRIEDLLPRECVMVTMTHRGSTARRIDVEGDADFIARLRAALKGSERNEG
jgi:tRNA threonylcarbamoyladenosine biosynthesis protein TsaE